MADEYRRFWITSSNAVERECLLAEAFEAGAEGAEERDEVGTFRACLYARASRIESVRGALSALAAPDSVVGLAEPMPEVDWSEAWKEGLSAIVISNRLVIRPPFVDAVLEPGQREVVIDPGQAFGIGGHASTRLCLEWIDALFEPSATAAGHGAIDRVLDVGTGSGVLALAAAALGAQEAIGFDLDPVATTAAREAAAQNQLSGKTRFFTGGIEALRDSGRGFPLVLANLLKQEMLPIASEIAGRVGLGGRLVLAGLLEEDVPEVLDRFGREQLVESGRRSRDDATGSWVGLCLARE